MNHIHILSSTDRPDSNALKISSYVEEYIQDYVNAELFSLMDFPLQEVAGGRYGEEIQSVDEFNEAFLNADGFIFVVPEYNGGFPGILKLFIDYLPFPEALNKKPVSFIGESKGSFGALRPVSHLQQILTYRQAIVYPERIFINGVEKNFDRKAGLKSARLQTLLEDQLNGFIDFVDTLNA